MDLSDVGKKPVRPGRPAGDDARYDPVFDLLQAEIDRASLPSVAGAVDWEKVVNLAADILSEKSKDLLVAGYLAAGLIHTRGVDGLALALKIHRDLIEHHCEGLFPQRERGRLRAVEWWLEKSLAALTQLEGSPISRAQLAQIEDDLAKLGELLGQMLPDPPSLHSLQDFLRKAARREPAVDDDPQPPPSALAEAPIRSLQNLAVVQEAPLAATSVDGRAAMEEGLHRLREAAEMLRDQDLLNPVVYRLSRQAAWLGVTSLPPAKEGRTLLPSPPTVHKNRLGDLRRSGDLIAYLKEIEALLAQFIFWLDLNRFAAEALTELGAAQPAVAAIGEETSFLLQRLPGLHNLAFADGTPFADAETKEWLRKVGCVGGIRATAPPPEPVRPESCQYPSIEDEVGAASALIANGDLIEAVNGLQARLDNIQGERERLRWRLSISRLLIDTDHARFALPYLEQVVSDIDRFGLESYDPSIALEGLKLAWHVFEAQDETGYREQSMTILHRIARIDLTEMVRLSTR